MSETKNKPDQPILLKDSERMVAAILGTLMQNGVRRTDLELRNLNAMDQTAENANLFVDAMLWLIAENIVRHANADTEGYFSGCTLTAHGFSLLSQNFVFFDEIQTVGAAIQKIERGETDYAGYGDFIGGILGGLAKSLSS